MATEDRVTVDCRDNPEGNCSLTISGKENEVMEIAEYHMTSRHGWGKEGVSDKIRSALKHESMAR